MLLQSIVVVCRITNVILLPGIFLQIDERCPRSTSRGLHSLSVSFQQMLL